MMVDLVAPPNQTDMLVARHRRPTLVPKNNNWNSYSKNFDENNNILGDDETQGEQ